MTPKHTLGTRATVATTILRVPVEPTARDASARCTRSNTRCVLPPGHEGACRAV